MISDVNKQLLQRVDSLEQLASRICGYGYYAYHKDDRGHPIPKEAVKEYLEMGAMFQQNHGSKTIEDVAQYVADYANAGNVSINEICKAIRSLGSIIN